MGEAGVGEGLALGELDGALAELRGAEVRLAVWLVAGRRGWLARLTAWQPIEPSSNASIKIRTRIDMTCRSMVWTDDPDPLDLTR